MPFPHRHDEVRCVRVISYDISSLLLTRLILLLKQNVYDLPQFVLEQIFLTPGLRNFGLLPAQCIENLFVQHLLRVQTSLKKGLVEEGSDATIVAESTILRNLSKPSAFIPTQLMTLQDTKVTITTAFVGLHNSRAKRLLILHEHQVLRQ